MPQRLEGGAGKVCARQTDRRERRQGVLGEVHVVEADHREILRHALAGHVRRAQNADGGHVVGANDGARTVAELAQLLIAGDAAFERVVALNDPLLANGQAGGCNGGAEIVLARDGGVEAVRAGEESDGAMAEADEMANGCVNAGCVVENDRAGLGVFEFELGEDDGNAAVHELVENRFLFAESHHGDAIDLAL